MSFVAVIFVIILCTVNVKCKLSDTESVTVLQQIDKFTKIKQTSVNVLKEVEIGSGNEKSIICNICYPPVNTKNHHSHMFYLTLNCKFGDWVLQRLFKFLELSPLLYQYKFQTYHLYNNVLRPRFDSHLNELLAEFNDYVDKFINALTTTEYLNIGYSFYNNNKSILKSLLSLKMKSYIIPKIKDKEFAKNYKNNFEIIQLIIIDMLDIQRFLTVNCLERPASRKNSQLFGIWLLIDDTLTNDDIDLLLDIVNVKIKLNPNDTNSSREERFNGNSFGTSNIFLANIVDVEASTDISIQIMNATVKITEYTKTPLNRVYSELLKFYDIDVSLMFYDYVITVIMKIIVDKIRNIMKYNNSINVEMAELIKKINSIMLSDESNFPKDFVLGFQILSKIKSTLTNDIQLELNAYYDSLSNVELTSRAVEVLSTSQFQGPKQNINQDMNDREAGTQELLILLQKIEKNIQDLKLFMQFFEPIRNEQQKYSVPLVTDKYNLIIDENNISTDKCYFPSNIYELCLQAFMFFNGVVDNIDNDRKQIFLKRTQTAFDNMIQYSLLIIKKNTPRFDILKMVYQITIILINLNMTLDDQLLEFKVKRVLNATMNEMNSYYIKNCTTKETNFMILNNINFNNFGNGRVLKNSMKKFFLKNVYDINDIDLNLPSINVDDYKFFSIKYFYNKFVISCLYCSTYKDKIKIKWNGLMQTMTEVFQFENILIFDSLVVYALHDVFLKYSAGVIFFQIREIVTKLNSVTNLNAYLADLSSQLKSLDTQWYSIFPQEMTYLVKEMEQIINVRVGDTSKLNEKKEYIEKQLNMFGIYFVDSTRSTGMKIFNKDLSFSPNLSSTDFKKNIGDLLSKVRIVSENFLKLISHHSIEMGKSGTLRGEDNSSDSETGDEEAPLFTDELPNEQIETMIGNVYG